ncbi:tRNA 2-thiouridine(34) synthase MnmA [Mycoplasmopsis agassizii]|uniref:tRNA-specific 2-thiouridylase MnmA n=1 Tax=Mycoplasmopsis agassizii TaxID=33922 RepID=A0ABX4H465_9BACT|nr:tRNA 2-thiouridine(34) synthase MnmA [Mycoplasmopsis agassizii]PAF54678.1 tRNA 2-thiouridine(34) synthase MnmA [Mycoplasmopsis agassizii]SMC16078.1 tRNA-specific 2-thiouridylase [Mycoplasmopsis agassizii]
MAKVVVGLSGGVDSSVAAYLLKQQGHEVIAVFMRNWDSYINNDFKGNSTINDSVCPQELDYQDAQKVAKALDIELHRVDFIQEYWDHVFTNFIDEFKKGRTPNPDILCNKYIKFDKFLNYALKTFNADYIAMGHYAKTKGANLYKAKDQNKDQSYFLAQLSPYQVSKTLMPLANLTKPEIRAIAKELNLITASKKDSTGICFIGERNFQQFLQNYIPAQPGKIISTVTNEVVGQHYGAMYYTLGQRKGLNLGGMKEPHFVSGFDLEKAIIYVSPQSHEDALISYSLDASNFNFIGEDFDNIKWENITAKFRYRQVDEPVKVEFIDKQNIKVYYPQGSKAVTPGQQVVLYQNERCLGGAVIEKTYLKKLELGNVNA